MIRTIAPTFMNKGGRGKLLKLLGTKCMTEMLAKHPDLKQYTQIEQLVAENIDDLGLFA